MWSLPNCFDSAKAKALIELHGLGQVPAVLRDGELVDAFMVFKQLY